MTFATKKFLPHLGVIFHLTCLKIQGTGTESKVMSDELRDIKI